MWLRPGVQPQHNASRDVKPDGRLRADFLPLEPTADLSIGAAGTGRVAASLLRVERQVIRQGHRAEALFRSRERERERDRAIKGPETKGRQTRRLGVGWACLETQTETMAVYGRRPKSNGVY